MSEERDPAAPPTRSVMALLALLAAPLALFLGSAGSGAEIPEKVPEKPAIEASQARSQEPPDACVNRFLRPLTELAGKEDASAGSRSSSATSGWLGRVQGVLRNVRETLGEQTAFDTIVATIADPIDSGLGYQFETSLRALRMGVEFPLVDFGSPATSASTPSDRFFRDRSFLPWDDRDQPSDDRRASEECRRSLPGILLFRGNKPGAPRLLALLLVGETPTTGVHETALVNALRVTDAFASSSSTAASPTEGYRKIVGPTFSGSAYSLRLALSAWRDASPEPVARVRIVTGTATGSSLKGVLTLPEAGAAAGSNAENSLVEFRATTPPEIDVLCNYLHFVAQRLGAEALTRATQTILQDVALLRESGTEFGGATQQLGLVDCPYDARVNISFPVQISALRDAYEDMDQQTGKTSSEPAIARRTTLDISLREKRPRDLDAAPSPKTTFAQDVALSNVLGAISRESVRHVGIQATDIADAIFIARKIRDVAPDVRLAFFTSDVLLLHRAFSRDLVGSLVVSPYPFLGSTEFVTSPRDTVHNFHDGFENASSEGMFNAVLAARGGRISKLREYEYGLKGLAPDAEGVVLPIWVSAIGRTGMVPILALPRRDAQQTTYLVSRDNPRQDAEKKSDPGEVPAFLDIWKAFRPVELTVDNHRLPPRLWHFVYVSLWFAFFLDRHFRRRVLGFLSLSAKSGKLCSANEADTDLTLVRTKWRLYAALRSFTLAFALAYMSAIYALVFVTYPAFELLSPRIVAVILGACISIASCFSAARAGWDFVREYLELRSSLGDPPLLLTVRSFLSRARQLWLRPQVLRLSAFATPRNGLGESGEHYLNRFLLAFGFLEPENREQAARTSLAQLRALACLSAGLILFFTVGHVWLVAQACSSSTTEYPIDAMALMVVRTLPIANGVSPAAPTLLCLCLLYGWAWGRMARLRVAHGLSRISPKEAVTDLVATPISSVLYPANGVQSEARASAILIERRVINTILRPLTGKGYLVALGACIGYPVVPFLLKPPSTLEPRFGTWLLVTGLALCAAVIGNTLTQLVQYWLALEQLLKRVLQHRLGRSFNRVALFVSDSLNEQLMRSSEDVRRLGACVRRFDELVASGEELNRATFSELAALRAKRDELILLRARALTESSRGIGKQAAQAEAELGQATLRAAACVMKIVFDAWDGRLPRTDPVDSGEKDEAASRAAESIDDALSAKAFRYSRLQLRWLRNAEAFVATIVALLLNRHVRQFQIFVTTLTGCLLLLLLAISSYAFEPHRLLLTCMWGIVGSVVATGLWIYIKLDRNTLLSQIAGTAAGRVTFDWALLMRVFTLVIIPLLGIAAAQYPDVGNALYRLVEPFVRALR